MRVALEGRATTLAINIAKRDDRVGRVVDLESLPVDASRGAVAVTGTTGESRSTQRQHQPTSYSISPRRSQRYSRILVNAWKGAARRIAVVAVAWRV